MITVIRTNEVKKKNGKTSNRRDRRDPLRETVQCKPAGGAVLMEVKRINKIEFETITLR